MCKPVKNKTKKKTVWRSEVWNGSCTFSLHVLDVFFRKTSDGDIRERERDLIFMIYDI